jgi:hypothetical protein
VVLVVDLDVVGVLLADRDLAIAFAFLPVVDVPNRLVRSVMQALLVAGI